MIQFRHTRISKRFLDECGDAVLEGRSVALLGPRFGGKRFVHRELRAKLATRTDAPIVSFSIRTSDRVASLETIQYQLYNAAPRGEVACGDPLHVISQMFEKDGTCSILLAANIDRLPPNTARTFLERIRAMVERRIVTVVLSGTLDFRDLVSGPHSEFNCADQYVLQGFDEEIFADEMIRFSQMHRVTWAGPREDLRRLWEFTGGNRHFGRLLVMVAAERFPGPDGSDARPSQELFRQALNTDRIPSAYWLSLLRGPADLIAGAPGCWRDLEMLMANGCVPARTLDGAPEELELAGIAIREKGTLLFSSRFAECLVQSHFTPTRIGDLYAQNGQWDEAFLRYANRDDHDRIRPFDRQDRLAVESSIHALGAAMFAAAGEGSDKVRDLFMKGAEALLGFTEISFWTKHADIWVQAGPRPIPSPHAEEVAAYLNAAAADTPTGVLTLPPAIGRFAVATTLQSQTPALSAVVLLSGLAEKAVLSRDRNELASKVLQLFAGAYDHALQGQINAQRLNVRNRHVSILNQLFDFSGGTVSDVRKVFELTGTELLKLGYRRVMFCLVDSRRERILGVMDIPGTHNIDLAKITDYPVPHSDAEVKDLQQWVFFHRTHKIVSDVAKEPLASRKCREAKSIKAIAIVPILDRETEVLGSIHIEREDGAVPTQQEVEDLELFGRQLARILVQTERMTLVQQSMDGSNEPIMITNPSGDLVYVNGTAAQHLNIRPGWQETPIAKFAPDSEIGKGIAQAVQPNSHTQSRPARDDPKPHTSVHQVHDFGDSKDYQGEVLIASLRDWRGQTIGCFVDVHDLRWLHNVIEALTKVGPASSAESAIDAIFDVVTSFGYTCVRLYVVDSSGKRLKSKRAMGLQREDSTRKFNSGKIDLSYRDDDRAHTWNVFKRAEPVIYHWGDFDGVVPTRTGLAAISLADPVMPPELGKKRGDWWFEVPLYIGSTEYGKISVDCDAELKPEAFETMRLLVQQSRRILEACREREDLASAHEIAVKDGLEASMAAVAHNLGSRLAALPVILGRYQQREERYPDLAQINEDFAFLVDQAMRMIDRTKELLGKVTLRYSVFDMEGMMRRALSTSLPEQQYCLESRIGKIEADSGVLEAALVELIQNSRQFARSPESLFVKVSVIALEEGRILIHYRDNGPGVPVEYKQRIFEEFFGHRPGMKRSTGLGLSFVRKAVEAHGGMISEIGKHGSGVHFMLEIPAQWTV